MRIIDWSSDVCSSDLLLQRPVDADILQLEPGLFDGTLLRRGGTILGTTNKGDPFDYPLADGSRVDRSAEVIEGYRRLKLDALIGIGGDGIQAILRPLAHSGGSHPLTTPKHTNQHQNDSTA